MFPRMVATLYRALPVTLALVALASCSSGDVSSSDGTVISSARVTDAVARLDTLAADVMTRSGIPGMAVAVVHQGRTVYAKGFGVRKLGDPAPVDALTVFQLASVSKPLGATVVASQVGKNVVAWNSPVIQHLPWFSLKDPDATSQATLGDLYSHQSGLPDHAGDDLEDQGHGRRQVLERLRFLPSAPLRSRYAYTNFGLTAAAEATAVAAGMAWEDLSEQVLYRPLGMTATSSRHVDFIARSNRAHPHIRLNGAFQPGSTREPDAQSPAGGVSSNVLDIATWMSMVLRQGEHAGQQLIPREALLPALMPQFMSSPPRSEGEPAGYYGYGFNVSTSAAGHKTLGHSGGFIMGAGTSFYLLPAADTGIVVLTNAWPVGAAEALGLMYLDIVQYGELTRDWLETVEPAFAAMTSPTGKLAGQPFPAAPVPALPQNAYEGVYMNDYYGAAEVAQRDGSLVLVMGPARRQFVLRHWDGNVFVFEPGGELAAPGSRSAVTFAPGPGGLARSITIELYEESGLATLTRG